MKFSIRARLDYTLPAPADVLLQVEAAILPEQKVLRAHIELPAVAHFTRVPGHDRIGERIWLIAAESLIVNYEATVEPTRLVARLDTLAAVPPHLLPGPTVDYLMPSRYCPSDNFLDLVQIEFSGLAGGARVAAISEWIGSHLSYVPGSSGPNTCAQQTFITRKGVCRDFAHLMITLIRASAIPARFASVYGLGVEPQDFHAVAEVFLDGAWHLVDATGMSRPEGIAKIGVGRDAADVSFLTSYGAIELKSQSIEVTRVS